VNFLLHHRLAWLDLGRPAAAAGAMLPDVWRMADRRARARPSPGPRDAGAAGDVSDGVAHHLSVDAWFHGAEVFTRGEALAAEALGRAREARKARLFAHVAWELCLDGALLRRLGTESVLRDVARSIDAVRPDAHRRAANLHTALRPDERDAFDVRVDRILDAIARGPWVADYASASGVVERLDGVRARLGFAALSEPDRDVVTKGLGAFEREADAAIQAMLESRRA
jgi:hypothetical protein